MITIENKNDIELLLELSELFNFATKSEDKDTYLDNLLNQMNDLKVKQANAKNDFAKELLSFKLELKEIKKDLADVKLEIFTENDEECSLNTYRQYPQSIYEQMPLVIKMNKDGSFLTRRGTAKWNIEDILFLKKEIPNVNKSFKELSEKLGYSEHTIHRLCCAIEHNHFERYLHEWEQIQADTFYKENHIVPIQNNPQKRKENGMI